MGNQIQIKVTCLTNENKKDEFHFDYYDCDGNLVGTIMVDETGKLEWSILNNKYENVVLDIVSTIFGFDFRITNGINYINEGKEKVPIRFQRAMDLINSRGLVVNYKQNKYFDSFFSNGTGKRRK